MRVVVLCSSPYSETGCAAIARLAQREFVPTGVITLPSWDRRTLLRKVGQWGLRDSFRYAAAKLAPAQSLSDQIRNPYLEKFLRHGEKVFRNIRDAAHAYGFRVVTCKDQNSSRAISQLKRWSPDVVIFTGGNILREEILKVPSIGIVNSHLGLLPEIGGMSCPEWSLLCGVPLGLTIHFMDRGIDTGPILMRREFDAQASPTNACRSLADLRNQMIAQGIELLADAVDGLNRGTISATLQKPREKDSQFFVMHERLKQLAARRLGEGRVNSPTDGRHG